MADTRSNGIGEAVYALQKSWTISLSPSTRGAEDEHLETVGTRLRTTRSSPV